MNSSSQLRSMNSSSGLKLFESVMPKPLAAIPGILIPAILVANILNLVTFKRMKKMKLQHYFMSALSIVDLMTLSAVVPSFIGLWRGHLWLSVDHCKIISILSNIFVATTDWLHCVICAERCYSILKPLSHRTLLTKYKPRAIAIKLSALTFFMVAGSITALTYAEVLTSEFDPSVASCLYHIDWMFFAYLAYFSALFRYLSK